MNADIPLHFSPGSINVLAPVTRFRLGQITLSELFNQLHKEQDRILSLFKEIRQIDMPEGFESSLDAEMASGELGINTIVAAVEHIVKNNASEQSLEEGLKMAERGYKLVNAALEMSVAEFECLSGTIEDLLSAQGISFD